MLTKLISTIAIMSVILLFSCKADRGEPSRKPTFSPVGNWIKSEAEVIFDIENRGDFSSDENYLLDALLRQMEADLKDSVDSAISFFKDGTFFFKLSLGPEVDEENRGTFKVINDGQSIETVFENEKSYIAVKDQAESDSLILSLPNSDLLEMKQEFPVFENRIAVLMLAKLEIVFIREAALSKQ